MTHIQHPRAVALGQSETAKDRPSPQALYWTYADIAQAMGHSIAWAKANMKRFEAQGFPAPAPWWRREKRWHAEAVRRWMAREELRAGAHGDPELRAIDGGRA